MEAHGPHQVHGGPVVLELGEGVGALIVHGGRELVGREVELERIESGSRTHTEVHERQLGDRTVFAGVFPQLPAGTYRVLATGVEIEIRGGEVSELELPVSDR